MMSKYPKTVKNKILTLKELLKKVKSLRSGKKLQSVMVHSILYILDI